MKSPFALLLIILALLVAACGPGADDASNLEELVVTASDIAYDVDRIEVTAGQAVELTLRNDGALEHDFSIMHIPAEMNAAAAQEEEDGHDMSHMEEMPELHVSAMPGESHVVSFSPTEPGEYTYFCSVSGHQEAGMSGTLLVAAP